MILFNRDVLFVHNPKTAGTSLLKWLGDALPDTGVAGVRELGTHHPHLPLALRHACTVTGNAPDQFKCILAVVREPVSRERSMYAHFRNLSTREDTPANLNDPAMEHWVRLSAACDANAYMRALESELGHCDIWRSREFYRLAGGKPTNMRVLRLSRLRDDLASALRGVFDHPPLPTLPELNQSDSSAVGFDDRSLDFIARSYAWMAADGVVDA